MPHFLDIKDLKKNQLNRIVENAFNWKLKKPKMFLDKKNIIMIFEKPSLRTRVSFEIGIKQLGGSVTVLNSNEFILGQRESVFDTIKVLERYVDMIIIRSFDHNVLREMSKISNVPVVNALTDHSHPCQVVSDLLTIKEKFGSLRKRKISWFGDCNNVTQSWIEAAVLFDMEFFIATPPSIKPENKTIEWVENNKGKIFITHDVNIAAENADCIMTDTWISMGDKKTKSIDKFQPYQVNKKIMSMASKNAIFMHCLPAYHGSEVTTEVLNSKMSVVFDQAENRLHAHKAILNYCNT
jgi:ornithine carbamoyltransferase